MLRKFSDRVRGRRGASMVEYLIVVGLIALLAFAAVEKVGKKLETKYQDMESKIDKINTK